MAEIDLAPAQKAQSSSVKPSAEERKPVKKTYSGLDLAKRVSKMFKSEYPGMAEASAMKLAVMLTKAQIKGGLDKG